MKHSNGFTLVELMIVVAIIGILTGISFAYYGDYVRASNRSEAQAALYAARGTLEKCRSLYGSYTDANCNYADFTTKSNFYDISAVVAATSFTLTATPVAGEPQANDADCTTLTLDNTGIEGATGAAADPTDECW